MSKSEDETPFSRLKDLFSYAFSKADYDDPHMPEAPRELKEFGNNTVFVTGAGLIFGGLKQWWEERRHGELNIPPGTSQQDRTIKLNQLRARRMIRIVESTVRHGLWCGWLGALYFGVEGLSIYARQTEDPWNTVIGAWASGSVIGFALGGPGVLSRLQNVALGIFIAGIIGYPAGVAQVYLNQRLRVLYPDRGNSVSKEEGTDGGKSDREQKFPSGLPYPVRDYDVVDAVIGKMGQSLEENSNEQFRARSK